MTRTADVHVRDGRTPEDRDRAFLPGMGKPWLLPLYDVFSRLAGIRRLQEHAVDRAGITAGQRVLDVGCGTGNLTFAVLRAVPGARVTGLDPDGTALRRAARKAVRRGVPLDLVRGYADHLPAADGTLDHVVSALAMHHVDEEGRAGFAREAFRALRPGGRVTILDLGGPGPDGEPSHQHRHGPLQRARHRGMHDPHVARNLDGGLVTLLAQAGFEDAHEAEHLTHRLGEVTIVSATRP